MATDQRYFRGERLPDSLDVCVTYCGQPLALAPPDDNEPPQSFGWGYNGVLPRRLARAILTKVVGKGLADKHYLHFTDFVISRLPYQSWKITENAVLTWLSDLYAGKPHHIK